MSSNLRSRILEAVDIRRETVEIPEWGTAVEVRGLTGTQRAKLMKTGFDAKGAADFEKLYPELIISSTFDPATGEAVFSEADRDALNGKSGAALERIAQAAMRLSGLTPDAAEQAEKNSEPTPSAASTSS
ncbi:MAG: 66, gp66 [Gemmatimonadetes bacterium]|nr:66, gp66 [Gemmatimonadota bacterium]